MRRLIDRQPILFALALALAAALVAPSAAHAKPKKDHPHASKHASKHVDKQSHASRGGPPPWAPAHGYRRKHQRARVYHPPYGIHAGTCSRELLGAALGGSAGGLLASEIVEGEGRGIAIVAGILVGATIGGSIGRSMDPLDQHCVGQVLEYASARQPVAWRNPDRETRYEVTPVRTYQNDDARYCREYRTSAVVAGEPQETFGTACRQPDGSWQILN